MVAPHNGTFGPQAAREGRGWASGGIATALGGLAVFVTAGPL
ncbi:hypothetical protein [Streptomyces griseus]|nr:hypothetical protein [Streptomyces griseus]